MSGDPADLPPSAVAFGRPLARWCLVLLASVVPGLVFLSGVLVSSTRGGEKIASGAAVLAVAVPGVRIARPGIFAGPGHLAVRDIFRAYRACWPQIAGGEMPPRQGTWRNAGLRIHLTDGRLIPAALYARGRFGTGRAAAAAVRELDTLRRQRIADRADQQPPAAAPGPERSGWTGR